jgi:threonine/homoserine/homoserine lactone efflux protein
VWQAWCVLQGLLVPGPETLLTAVLALQAQIAAGLASCGRAAAGLPVLLVLLVLLLVLLLVRL